VIEDELLRRISVAPFTAPATPARPDGSATASSAPRRPAPGPVDAPDTGWGALPASSVMAALGVLMLSFGYTDARAAEPRAVLLFWTGLLLLFVPIAAQLMAPVVPRRERVGLVVLLGLGLYLAKVLHSPLDFTYHDEMIHWRTVNDILRTLHLFGENSLIPVSPLYPGLEITTSALVSLSGLSVFGAGTLVLGVGRLVLVLALFRFMEEAAQSARVAGIGTMLYMANPSFVFFDAQFAYESLALPFLAVVLFVLARRARENSTSQSRLGLTVAALLGLIAVVTTHHMTTYALVAFLGLWTLTRRPMAAAAARFPNWLGRVWRKLAGDQKAPMQAAPGFALLALVLCLAWLVYVGSLTVGYLAPVLTNAITEVLRLILGEATARQLFQDTTGQVAPAWERIMGYAAVLCIVLGLPFGLLQVWRRHRTNPLALALGAAALTYPASLGLRLVQAGGETSSRASEFLFLAVAFVLAEGVVVLWPAHPPDPRRIAFLSTWAGVVFMGNVIVGNPPWGRMPGPYLVAADTRSIEPQGIGAAEWARTWLGPENRVLADRINGLLMASRGDQRVVTNNDKVYRSGPFFSPTLTQDDREVFQLGRVHYLVIDHRLSTALPLAGVYVESGEPDTSQHTVPIDPAALSKYDSIPGVYRVFDSGDIVIYDVAALAQTSGSGHAS